MVVLGSRFGELAYIYLPVYTSRILEKHKKVKKEQKSWSLLMLWFLFLSFQSHICMSVPNGVSLLTLSSSVSHFSWLA